jgi:DNA-binding PadR family transcriptional regulator
MFGHHRSRGGHGRGHHERGGWFEEMRERKASHRRERLFEQGDLKLVVLDLLQSRPRHGYEIIKEIGHASVTQESGGKKQYGITAEGSAHLAEQREALARIRGRLESAGSASDARRTPELQRSMQNFKTALHFRLSRTPLEPEQLRKIAEAIDRAAVDIERS